MNPALLRLYDEKMKNIYILRPWAIAQKVDFINNGHFNADDVFYIDDLQDMPYLNLLDVHVCDNCNMNCKGCTHFSPFIKGQKEGNLNQFEKEMKKLKDLFCNIGHVSLMGGEPLLEPELCCKMAEITRRYFPYSDIFLLTNGTLIPQMTSDFWEAMRRLKVIVWVSLYPPVFDKGDEYHQILKENHLKYAVIKEKEKFTRFLTLKEPQTNDMDYVAEINHKRCISTGCHVLHEGYLAHCPVAVMMSYMGDALGVRSDELISKDIIKLEDATDGWEVVRKLESPCDFCIKCDYRHLKKIQWEAAGNSPDPYDWLLEGVAPDYKYEIPID